MFLRGSYLHLFYLYLEIIYWFVSEHHFHTHSVTSYWQLEIGHGACTDCTETGKCYKLRKWWVFFFKHSPACHWSEAQAALHKSCKMKAEQVLSPPMSNRERERPRSLLVYPNRISESYSRIFTIGIFLYIFATSVITD